MFSLVDCNNFYCSCERIFQPKLRNVPVLVLSNNDGCVIARSNEVKALGITIGTPAHHIEQLIKEHRIAVFSSNYTLYQDMSDRVMNTLASFVQNIELYSIDEAFLDMSAYDPAGLEQVGSNIRQTVLQHTGIPVSVGIAPTKTLAKMANRYTKKKCTKKGLFYANSPAAIREMLEQTKVEDIWGIGRQHTKLLLRNGFTTAAELSEASDAWVLKNMTVTGHRLLNELRGIPSIDGEMEDAPKKGICTSRSFGKLMTTETMIQQAVSDFAENCALKLRRQNACAARIHVFLSTNPNREQDKQYHKSISLQLPVATAATPKLIQYAISALHLIFKQGYNYNKAGVILYDIVPADTIQLGMFSTADTAKEKKVMQAYDALNGYYGKGMVRYAQQGYEKPYALRAAHLSKKYTTRMEDILKVR
jgi:DNA polymerase V